MTRCNVVVRIWYGDSIDMCAEKPAFRTRLRPILTISTRCQTGWNVTKCHACHAKRHDNLLGNLRKGNVLRLPPKTRRSHRKTRDSRRDAWEHQNEHFVRDFLQLLTLCSFRIDVFLRVFLGTSKFATSNYLKIDVSCEASVNFQHMSRKCHACHGICTLSPLDAALPM